MPFLDPHCHPPHATVCVAFSVAEPLSQQPNNGADAETAQHLMRNAKLDAARARELTENSHQKLFRIKTEELVLEEKLIKSGTHPDYMEALAEIQKRMDDRTRESADRLRYAVKACESTYDSNIKFAHDTFLEAKRGLRWKMYRTATRSCFQLNAEYEQLRIMSHPVPNFTALPEVISKRKWDMMDSYENGNLRADVERSIPDWTRLVVHKRRRAGYFRLYVPPPCVGLDENEMDQDMEAIRTGTTGSADQKARPGGPKKAGKPPRN
ncbi:hypothetical protein BC831DRAFT_465599 [Entophlyctis helioformis]|nr:hypothetical protein BC831DRAFT_465599 [Entophlyctis helioformis]